MPVKSTGDWALVQIERQVRAYNPWPSAFTMWRGHNLKIMCAHADFVAPVPVGAVAGQVIDVPGGAAVVTGGGVLRLDEVQLAGKRVLPVDAFLRGASSFIGSRLPS